MRLAEHALGRVPLILRRTLPQKEMRPAFAANIRCYVSEYPGTKKWYGSSGNSFVAVVEFGDRVRAMAVTAGGESGDPKSPHFNDQGQRYSMGDLREVYFYSSQLQGHSERQYHPGS